MDNILFSVIILSYKNLEYIEDTIKSVIGQDYKDIELIIADDCTDGIDLNKFKKYIDINNNGNIKNVIIYKNKVNLGIVKNINKALSVANGDYIKIIDSDDCFYSKSVLSDVADYFNNNDSIIITTKFLQCDINMKPLVNAENIMDSLKAKLIEGSDSKKFYNKLCAEGTLIDPGVFFKKDFFKQYGMLDESYIHLNDLPLWLRVTRNGCKMDFFDIVSVKYRVGSGISNQDKKDTALIDDIIRCYNEEIFKYKKQLDYYSYKKARYIYIKSFELNNYSIIKKISFLIGNLDIIFIKIKNKILRSIKN